MLRLALVFFVVAVIAGLFGFSLVADVSWDTARILFFVFLILAVVMLVGDAAAPHQGGPVESV